MIQKLVIAIVMVAFTFLLFFISFNSQSDSLLKEAMREDEMNKLRFINATLHRIHSDLSALRFDKKMDDSKIELLRKAPPEKHDISPVVSSYLNNAKPEPTVKSSEIVEIKLPTSVSEKTKTAIIFTMDSISQYEENSRRGGAAGELAVRYALQEAFDHFGVKYKIIKSDQEFDRESLAAYDMVLLDSWTWAAKGWVPKRNIVGHESKIFILDFFGAKSLRNHGMNLSPTRFLTAFPSVGNTFLGYYIPPTTGNFSHLKLNRGIIWGKDVNHFDHRHDLLNFVASLSPLVSTSSQSIPHLHRNIEWKGHQTPQSWKLLLQSSKFLLGLGHPLMGPSALDAISQGCMYLNPIYSQPFLREQTKLSYTSQHPYVADTIGSPYVCSFHLDRRAELKQCVEAALASNLPPFIPNDFTKVAYFTRVQKIFDL